MGCRVVWYSRYAVRALLLFSLFHVQHQRKRKTNWTNISWRRLILLRFFGSDVCDVVVIAWSHTHTHTHTRMANGHVACTIVPMFHVAYMHVCRARWICARDCLCVSVCKVDRRIAVVDVVVTPMDVAVVVAAVNVPAAVSYLAEASPSVRVAAKRLLVPNTFSTIQHPLSSTYTVLYDSFEPCRGFAIMVICLYLMLYRIV